MIVGNYNHHQILFSLEMFDTKEDKLGYLYKLKKELQRIIRCFDSSKTLPLRMYAVDNIQIEGNCEELKTFIRRQFELQNNPWEKRNPSEGKLRALMTKEVVDYKKFTLLIENEIKLIEQRGAKPQKIPAEPKNTYVKIKKIDHLAIASLIKDRKEKIVWEYSIGELIDLVNDIMNKKLIKGLDENNLSKFIVANFVDRDEEDFSLEKIEHVYSMFLKTIWLSKTEINTRYFQ
ncbi:MAG: hypothetical protein GXO85_17510 [Chlorobi bacterium]|nr:hypothetical protein [Chlorobiota bacterium]